MASNITNDVTLGLLLNPLYQTEILRTKGDRKETVDKRDLKFYRKRISGLSRDIMRGDIVNKSVQDAHDDYVNAAIRYFKINDRSDILQDEYVEQMATKGTVGSNTTDADTTDADKFSMNDANEFLFETKPVSHQTLDNFVINKTVKETGDTKLPQRRIINLKTNELRRKGLHNKR
jgi:hypothetical protein